MIQREAYIIELMGNLEAATVDGDHLRTCAIRLESEGRDVAAQLTAATAEVAKLDGLLVKTRNDARNVLASLRDRRWEVDQQLKTSRDNSVTALEASCLAAWSAESLAITHISDADGEIVSLEGCR